MKTSISFFPFFSISLFALLVAFIFQTLPGNAATIQKCQDADGKWHYGDVAAEICRQSKITELNKSGVEIRELDVPPSEEELKAKREAAKKEEQERQEREARQQLENRLLATYDSEQSLIDARDQRVVAIDRQIEINNEFLRRFKEEELALHTQLQDGDLNSSDKGRLGNSLQNIRAQIRDYEDANREKTKEKTLLKEKFNLILEEYRAVRKKRGLN